MNHPHSKIDKDPAQLAHGQLTGLTHIAIIMDGNGRWAVSRGLPRIAGHKRGAEALRATLEACRNEGVKWLTVYAFSSENWKRPVEEVSELMGLLKRYISKEMDALHKAGTRVRFIGDMQKLSPDVRELVATAEEKTARNETFFLNVALSYGSQQELVHACKTIVEQVKKGTLAVEDINEDCLNAALYTSDMPAPDLLIRTGGEQRLSNFLLWQMAYTELYFTDTLWPDFNTEHFKLALSAFATRERRYGNTES
jgi:undecaprenyl diphosphate synthase